MNRPTNKQAAVGGIAAVIITALAGVYANEGGYADHPNDKGGKTNYGVTEKVARAYGYRGHMRNFPKHCDAANPVCADLIYTKGYIDRPGYRPFASLSPAVLYELVDSAVLHGPGRATRWFYATMNNRCGASLRIPSEKSAEPLKVDAVAAFKACQIHYGPGEACLIVLEDMEKQQRAYFEAIVRNRPSQRVFLKGWLNRRIGNVPRGLCFA